MVPLDGPYHSCNLVTSTPMGTNLVRKHIRARVAQVKIRLPELLRRDLEHEAARKGLSMNAEIIKRLDESFRVLDQTKLIAKAVLSGLDDAVVDAIERELMRMKRDAYEAEAQDD